MLKVHLIACVAAGLIALPAPAEAELFTRGGGLVYDDYLDITWLQDANYPLTLGIDPAHAGQMEFAEASQWVENLSYFDSVRQVTWDDWRLPTSFNVVGTSADEIYDTPQTETELGHLMLVDLGNPFKDTTANNHFMGPFYNIVDSQYWTNTPYTGTEPVIPNSVLTFYIDSGQLLITSTLPGNQLTVWAVRDGDVAAVAEPSTLAVGLLTILGHLTFSRRQESSITREKC